MGVDRDRPGELLTPVSSGADVANMSLQIRSMSLSVGRSVNCKSSVTAPEKDVTATQGYAIPALKCLIFSGHIILVYVDIRLVC